MVSRYIFPWRCLRVAVPENRLRGRRGGCGRRLARGARHQQRRGLWHHAPCADRGSADIGTVSRSAGRRGGSREALGNAASESAAVGCVFMDVAVFDCISACVLVCVIMYVCVRACVRACVDVHAKSSCLYNLQVRVHGDGFFARYADVVGRRFLAPREHR